MEVSQSTHKRTWTAIRVYQRQLNIGTAPADPRDYLPKFLDELEDRVDDEFESETILQTALDLLQTAINKNYHDGNKTTGLAGGAIYAAAQMTDTHITQSDLSDVCETSMTTLRRHYRNLLELKKDKPKTND